jgi:hypothetical protein
VASRAKFSCGAARKDDPAPAQRSDSRKTPPHEAADLPLTAQSGEFRQLGSCKV